MLQTVRFILLVAAAVTASAVRAEDKSLIWESWSDGGFTRARAEQKLVILDLEAVWCHWCHVMEETTYRNPKVVELLKKHYVTIRADQDANPDLSARYGDWGWPATIIFAPDGSELAKRRGYISPENMASMLQAFVDDPRPGPSVVAAPSIEPAESSVLAPGAREALSKHFAKTYDAENGGWGNVHKFIDADSMDWALLQAERGNEAARRMATTTLDRAKALIDTEWGGIYQYSDSADWRSPHYEKIMWYQANGLRQYASAYAAFKAPAYLRAAQDIYRYITTTLSSPEGAFFATQDADVDRTMPGKQFYGLSAEARRRLGRQPRVDPNLYARENGWAISALIAFSDATGDRRALDRAVQAADWVVANRRNDDGMFRHGAADRGGPFLGDTVAMASAAIDLYAATGKRSWLDLAQT